MDQYEEALRVLPGAGKLFDYFGYWPTFHDAEIISLVLARKGESVLRLYPYDKAKQAEVEFIFEDITDIQLEDFSCQNVINGLLVERLTGVRVGATEVADEVRIILEPCYGLAGKVEARRVRIEVIPGKSSDGMSSW